MVKIKEGYVMNAREKAEFERVDALPRKKSGTVAYYYKPQTKYPPRIYVFMHAEIWCDRNRRPMGLQYAFPFLTRPMNHEEIEYHHFDIRLCYHQYEDWGKLIYAEEQEAERLDAERAGSGTAFLAELKGYQPKYPLAGATALPKQKTVVNVPDEETQMIRNLIENGQHYSVAEVGRLLDEEQHGQKRLPVLILLRELYKNLATPDSEPLQITAEQVEQKATLSFNRTRRNLARRVFKRNQLFALSEIQRYYPDYTQTQLEADLKTKRRKERGKKHKPVVDYRRCQLEKLAKHLKHDHLSEREYQQTCCRIVILQQAHDLRLPIPKTVSYNKRSEVYSFHWKTRETVIKSFVQQANSEGMTHERLAVIHQQMTSSNYSF
ncbi:hypothetical protein MTO98_15855 [Mucilaginibacter sp. SMC90]|uniref:hypothetical protein n=1 Tax=Mucilaginibacter sp. SMC90 TaxID=2929803 RepID=UPI001FB369C4|nr:hypothetical protein [Mucilaginibacter sp. SMC90]UOE52551.1 hypothetical protein MTO98_15855 [Mucilaginibacter sp. SMC90]